ncbi:MAG: DUF6477 family protein [Pseudomonadota bacterium]
MTLNINLQKLRRPKLLVRAARIGLETYNPKTSLPRIQSSNAHARLPLLMDEECALEEERKSGAATYNVQDHVKILTAVLFEAMKPPKMA